MLGRILQRLRGTGKWPRRLKFTREGKFFVGITLGVDLLITMVLGVAASQMRHAFSAVVLLVIHL